jgi:hypothetical protein
MWVNIHIRRKSFFHSREPYRSNFLDFAKDKQFRREKAVFSSVVLARSMLNSRIYSKGYLSLDFNFLLTLPGPVLIWRSGRG